MPAFTIVTVNKHLRALRTTTRHSEGIIGEFVVIRDGDKEMAIDAVSFFEIAKRLGGSGFHDNDVRYGEWDF